jgi:sigma-54 dependent transcriptional regulator, acetoin dehydrogenase operon transcriptional activator AcoR
MLSTLDILFIDDRGLGLERLAAASLARRCGERARAFYLAGAPTAHAADPGGASAVTADEAAQRSFDAVVLLSPSADAATASPVCGVPAVLSWPTQPEGAADSLEAEISAFVDRGYLAALDHERGRLQRFADMMDEGIIIHDDRRRVFFVNRAATALTGHEAADVVGRDCHLAFPPHGLCGTSCQFCADDGEGADGRATYETAYVDPDGVPKRLKVTSELMEIAPGTKGVLAVLQDLTEVSEMRRSLGERRKFHGMVGVSSAVHDVFESIRAVSASDYSVLITGESGTGKELVASAIHQESARSAGPFVPVNCGALPVAILESELFGHVRGAFTGAIRDKKGRFELAHGGTLFLDEVGELSPQVQVKLLRVLQDKRIERVGGEQSIAVDVRIISATNRDLRAMVEKGRFREDLFYRLCVVPIHLPPLRERREDIPYLIDHILARISIETGKAIRGVDDRALDLLLAHTWPGNVREQINALQFASIHCDGEIVRAEHLPPEIRRLKPVHRADRAACAPHAAGPGRAPPEDDGESRFKLTRAAVESALSATHGNKVRAAKLLGVGRATLYRFFERLEADKE